MCGRYAMGIRAAFIRYRLQERGQQVDEVANDEEIRETFNFAPGSHGAVLRAETPDQDGSRSDEADDPDQTEGQVHEDQDKVGYKREDEGESSQTKYKIQAMKWGLIPFWTKRSPNYGSLMKTINCRDDSLKENKGMWTSMKKRKRCIVVCQGFYEWLKIGPGGKERKPYFVRRKDRDLMCFAGLWDVVKYEDSNEKLYTYTVITTDSNPYLRFLHDRMPVILEPGSEAMTKWLDPRQTTWTKDLQSLLKPYEGELETYPVCKGVGKVGNNSPDFIVPINSKENKKNIANFFSNVGKSKTEPPKQALTAGDTPGKDLKDEENTKDLDMNAEPSSRGLKREYSSGGQPMVVKNNENSPKKMKLESSSQVLKGPTSPKKRMHSATKNSTSKISDSTRSKSGNQCITNFFKK
ncbi:hypothetical protein FQN57_002237 [Myotisia sp. PD_48]|nr:hypothetical protein FQN57_002237 [Myotisia sp. PD_48]